MNNDLLIIILLIIRTLIERHLSHYVIPCNRDIMVKIGINGFGRIGRLVFRKAYNDPDIDIVGINDISDSKTLAHLLKYDTTFGILNGNFQKSENGFTIDGKEFKVFAERDPANLPWNDVGAEVVIESTGLFRSRDTAAKHLDAGAKKVIISAPSKKPPADITIVLGVNEKEYQKDSHHVLSNASCTTNCLAPIAKVLHDNFKIQNGLMTTIHAYTNDQRLLDFPHSDLRRARAAAQSMIPTSTGAAKAIGLVLPELVGKLNGLAVRVPTVDVSLVDLVVNVEKECTVDEIKSAFKKASQNELKGILQYCDEPLVSIDFVGNTNSAIFDADQTYVLGNTVKVLAWYDNEFGYACRLVDLVKYIS
jgi:glyceraldehyde-3-phosphate dehydrogenase type I